MEICCIPMSDGPEAEELRLDDLAAAAGVATTTIRLYQQKGLLHRPTLRGRTGWYDATHLARLRLIGQLQDQGFSLAGIGRLLESWEQGRDLTDLVGVEQQLDALLHRRGAIVLEPAELAARFPTAALTPELLARATAAGLVEPTDDGRFRVPDPRFLDTGAELLALGVPVDVVLDEWAHLAQQMDEVAERFVRVFEDHLLPADWRAQLDAERTRELATTLAQLQRLAGQVVLAALDASVARVASGRLAELVPPEA
jgi:DNA-binding transcriptional MerR regulator